MKTRIRLDKADTSSPVSSRAEERSTAPERQALTGSPRQMQQARHISQLSAPKATAGGLPEGLARGMTALSGVDLSDVQVHTSSSRPAQLNAEAYAQGRDIHLAPGKERHLAHEAWHIVQQRQGRVRPTAQIGGQSLNDDPGLEREADVMGARAQANRGANARGGPQQIPKRTKPTERQTPVQPAVQRVKGIQPDTHVAVNDGGPTWYGQVVSVDGDNYTIRVGGMETETTVHERQVDFHPVHKSVNKQGVENFLYDKDGRIKKGMSPKDEQQRLNIAKNPGQASNVGKYVFHSTSYQNLPSILSNGIDPAKGGGSGGSCELCEEGQLKQTSIENSKNKIAVAVDRLTMGTYINQREDFASKPEQGDSARHTSVLLRFKVQERHQGFKNSKNTISSTWSKDPDDKRAWHLSNTPVLPAEIEFLSHDGWHPLVDIRNLDQMLDEQILASPMSVSQMPKGEFQRDYPGLDLVF